MVKKENFDGKWKFWVNMKILGKHGNFQGIKWKFPEILVTKCQCIKLEKQLNGHNSVLNFRRPKILISNILTRKRTHLIALWVHILSVYYKNTDNPIIAGLPIICMIKNENTFLVNLLFFIYQIYSMERKLILEIIFSIFLFVEIFKNKFRYYFNFFLNGFLNGFLFKTLYLIFMAQFLNCFRT